MNSQNGWFMPSLIFFMLYISGASSCYSDLSQMLRVNNCKFIQTLKTSPWTNPFATFFAIPTPKFNCPNWQPFKLNSAYFGNLLNWTVQIRPNLDDLTPLLARWLHLGLHFSLTPLFTCVGDGFTKKSCCSYGLCPNYLPPLPLPPIWTTCTTFFDRQKLRFKRHSKWFIVQNSS